MSHVVANNSMHIVSHFFALKKQVNSFIECPVVKELILFKASKDCTNSSHLFLHKKIEFTKSTWCFPLTNCGIFLVLSRLCSAGDLKFNETVCSGALNNAGVGTSPRPAVTNNT